MVFSSIMHWPSHLWGGGEETGMYSSLQLSMQSYFDLAGELVVAIDTSGYVTQVNKKTCQVLGVTQSEIVGQNWFETFLPHQIKESTEGVSAKLLGESDSESQRFINPVLTKSGEERLISWHNMVLRDDEGEIIGHLSSGEDITDRLKAEQTLQESEQRYRSLFEGAAEGILGVCISCNQVYLANPAMCSFFGYSKEELMQLSFEQMHPAESLDFVLSEFQSQAQGRHDASINIPCLRKDGTVVYADIKCSPIEVNGQPCLVGYFTDVTERWHAELAARESEFKYQQLVELAPLGIEELDLTGTIIYANPAYYGFYGYTRDELEGKKIWDLVPENSDKLKKYFEYLVREQPEPTPYMGTYLAKNGGLFNLQVDWDYKRDHNGNLVGFLSMITNTTDRIKAERALQKSESQFRAIMNSLKETSIVIYDRDTRVTGVWYDHEFDGRFGNNARDFVGKQPSDVLPPDQAQVRTKNIQHVIATGSKVHDEILSTLPSGDFWFDSTISPLVDEDGTTHGAVGFFRDITERKKAEQSLRENESQLRAIMNSLRGSSIVLYDYDGRVTGMWYDKSNDARHGNCASDYIGMLVTDVLPPDQAQARLSSIRDVIDHKTKVYTEEHRTLPGGDFWFDTTLSPLINDDGSVSGAVGFLRDVTERREAEQALHENESQLRAIMNSLRETTIIVYDYDGNITMRWEDQDRVELYGIGSDEMIGKNIFDIVPPDQAAERMRQIRHVIDTGCKFHNEHLNTLDAGDFWFDSTLSPLIDEDGSVTGAVGFLRDITDRKRAEQDLQELNARLESEIQSRTHTLSIAVAELKAEVARRQEIELKLRESEESFRSIVETSTDWIWEINLNFEHIYSNHRVQDVLGFTLGDIKELDFVSRFHPDDVKKIVETAHRCISAKIGWSNWVKRVQHKDGRYRFIESNAAPVINSAGEIVGFRGVDRDITQRVEAEEQLAEHKSSLAHVARLSTMGATVSGLAHELNQPLSALCIYADACARMIEPKFSGELGETLHKIADQAERAGKIIQRVQQFARKGDSHRSTFIINEVIQESVSFVNADAKQKNIRISLDLSSEIPFMVGDPIQIQQVIMNLIRNGFDSMMLVDLNERVLKIRSCLDEDDKVIIVVQDTGDGFHSANADDIFESFFTTKSEGMGLGLSISRSIIESHGGHIAAKLNADCGASFIITLPICIGAYCESE